MTASSWAEGLASRPSSISRRVGSDPFRSIAANEEYCGHGCSALGAAAHPRPLHLQPMASPRPPPSFPAAQARRSSPVVSSGSVASVRLFEHSHVCKSTVYKACAKPVLCKPHNIFTDVTRWTVLCIEEGGLLPSPHTTPYSAVFLVPQSVSIDIVKP